jgi:hypothetical protein
MEFWDMHLKHGAGKAAQVCSPVPETSAVEASHAFFRAF